MATRAEVGSVTERVHRLSGELHEELVDGAGDFGRLAELAREVSRRTSSLATTFEQADELLSAQLAADGESD